MPWHLKAKPLVTKHSIMEENRKGLKKRGQGHRNYVFIVNLRIKVPMTKIFDITPLE